jgi:hypothetical protein
LTAEPERETELSPPTVPALTAPDSSQSHADPNEADSNFPRELRFIFVQLLFSLTAAEIAREAAELTLHDGGWRDLLPAYVHLLLATAVVSTSWVGWSVSEVSRGLKVDSVFKWPFFVLLTDVALVILYFILVRSAEVPRGSAATSPSALTECDMIALIFVGYFVWDVLTKAVIRYEKLEAPTTFLQRFFGTTMWARGWMSCLSMFLGLIAWYFLRDVAGCYPVMLVDSALICLVLAFRALKDKARLWRLAIGLDIVALALGITARFIR